jgi:hypothetical protein
VRTALVLKCNLMDNKYQEEESVRKRKEKEKIERKRGK